MCREFPVGRFALDNTCHKVMCRSRIAPHRPFHGRYPSVLRPLDARLLAVVRSSVGR
jgi:hypothetical protein